MRQLMHQHRLLRLRVNPVQQINRLRLGVVIACDLLLQQLQHERLQLKVAVQQPKLLQHNLPALHPLRVLVLVELIRQVFLHRVPAGQRPLYLVLDRQPALLRGIFRQLIHAAEQLLRLLGSNVRLGGGRFWLFRGRLRLSPRMHSRTHSRHQPGRSHPPNTNPSNQPNQLNHPHPKSPPSQTASNSSPFAPSYPVQPLNSASASGL